MKINLQQYALNRTIIIALTIFVLSALSLIVIGILAQWTNIPLIRSAGGETAIITQEEYKENCNTIDQRLQDNTATFDDYMGKGNCLKILENRTKEAQSYYLKSLPYFIEKLEQHPSVYSYFALASIYSEAGQYHEAIHAARRGISLDRVNPTSHNSLAIFLEQAGKYKEALEEYKAVLHWVEENGEGTLYAQSYTTDELTRAGLKKTIRRLEAILKKNEAVRFPEKRPTDQVAEEPAQDEYSRYCKQIQQFIQTAPRHAQRQAAWAYCQVHAGNLGNAEQAFLTALEEDAGNPYLSFFIANYYSNQGKYQKAINELRIMLGWDKYNPVFQYLLAKSYEHIGEFKEARKFYEVVAKHADRWDKQRKTSSQQNVFRGKQYHYSQFIGTQKEHYPTTILTSERIRSLIDGIDAQMMKKEKQP